MCISSKYLCIFEMDRWKNRPTRRGKKQKSYWWKDFFFLRIDFFSNLKVVEFHFDLSFFEGLKNDHTVLGNWCHLFFHKRKWDGAKTKNSIEYIKNSCLKVKQLENQKNLYFYAIHLSSLKVMLRLGYLV